MDSRRLQDYDGGIKSVGCREQTVPALLSNFAGAGQVAKLKNPQLSRR
jgi:hypothetical protein